MRAFVTGATGFIGRHLCRHLITHGHQVLALARNPRKAAELPASVELLHGDMTLFADAKTLLPPCDVVIHLAGVVAAHNLADYRSINFSAVQDLLACLARQDWVPKRLLFASSLAAAGPSSRDQPWTETDMLRPIDPYGAAKALAEALVARAPYPTTIFRPPIVFGPGDEATLTLFKAARKGLGIRLLGAAQQLSFVDVRDLVRAIVSMAEDTRRDSFVYYVSHPEHTDVVELWRELGRAVDKNVSVLPIPRWLLYLVMRASSITSGLFGHRNQLDAKQYEQMAAFAFLCSSSALTKDLGWQPQHDLARSLGDAARGYRALGTLAR